MGSSKEEVKPTLMSAAGKTPVSVLQELLSRRGTTPKYELVQIEGAIHEPTFRYRVTVSDRIAIGTGRSKKDAKHAAAKAILDQLIVPADDNSVVSTIQVKGSDVVSPYEDKIPGNPIGLLQELCMSRRWPPPNYDMIGEEGLPHERLFTIACTVFKHQEIGTGKSKKLAKRQAAHKMWEKLQDVTINTNNNHQLALDDDDDVDSRNGASISSRYIDLKDQKIPTLTTQHGQKVSSFHKNLKSASGPKLFSLQSKSLSDSNFNFEQFLQEIAAEQQFEVTYVDIEEKAFSGNYQCLVQLSTLPVAVCYGSGSTSKEAQSNAAHNALEYLKIMTKK